MVFTLFLITVVLLYFIESDETSTAGGSQELDLEMPEVPVESPNVTATEPSAAEGPEEPFAL